MKEATGELNMTVITVVAIAAIAGFFYVFIWPAIKNNIQKNTYCTMAACSGCTVSDGIRTCTTCSYDEDGDGTDDWTGQCTFNDSQ